MDKKPSTKSAQSVGNNIAYLPKGTSAAKEETHKPKAKNPLNRPINGLLVDDNYDFYCMVQESMGEDIALQYAADGFTALRMVKKQKFDILLCDVFMPMIDGITLLQEFHKKHLTVPFIFLSGHLSDKTIRDALQEGAYNVIHKPFIVDDLVEKIYKAIQLSQEEEVMQLAAQDKAYIYNTLKTYYYDVDKIMHSIELFNIPVSTVNAELEKKKASGKCLFDDITFLKQLRVDF